MALTTEFVKVVSGRQAWAVAGFPSSGVQWIVRPPGVITQVPLGDVPAGVTKLDGEPLVLLPVGVTKWPSDGKEDVLIDGLVASTSGAEAVYFQTGRVSGELGWPAPPPIAKPPEPPAHQSAFSVPGGYVAVLGNPQTAGDGKQQWPALAGDTVPNGMVIQAPDGTLYLRHFAFLPGAAREDWYTLANA